MSTKYTFSYESEYPNEPRVTKTLTIEGDQTVFDLLDEFRSFLLGVGFVIEGEFDIVEEDIYTTNPGWNFSNDDLNFGSSDTTISVSNYGAAQPVDHFPPDADDLIVVFEEEEDSEKYAD